MINLREVALKPSPRAGKGDRLRWMRLRGIGSLYAKINLIRLGFKYYRRATFPALGEGFNATSLA